MSKLRIGVIAQNWRHLSLLFLFLDHNSKRAAVAGI